jgi:hypothetical protein
MEVQVRHVHAGIRRTTFLRLGRKIIDISNIENVTRGSADNRSDRFAIESESVPSVLIHCIKREGYYVVLCLDLRRVWHRNSLG